MLIDAETNAAVNLQEKAVLTLRVNLNHIYILLQRDYKSVDRFWALRYK